MKPFRPAAQHSSGIPLSRPELENTCRTDSFRADDASLQHRQIPNCRKSWRRLHVSSMKWLNAWKSRKNVPNWGQNHLFFAYLPASQGFVNVDVNK